MVDIANLLPLGLNILSAVLVLALAALGLGIIFGLMGVINTAHGAFFTIGAYSVWFFSSQTNLGFWMGLVIAPIVGAVIGFVTERIVIRYMYDRLLDSILATWGVAIVIGELLKLIFGTTTKTVSNPLSGRVNIVGNPYPTYRIFIIFFSAAVLASIFAFVYYTNFGVRLRAVIQNPESAELLGINQKRMYQFSFTLGTALAALAGAAVTPFASIGPRMGLSYLLQSFFAIILGGAGTLLGIIPGSLIVAGGANALSLSIQPIVAQTVIFVIVIGIILVKPKGILSR